MNDPLATEGQSQTADRWQFSPIPCFPAAASDGNLGPMRAVPINLVASEVLRMRKRLIGISLGERYWADPSRGGPEGSDARMQFTLPFPK